MEDRLLTIARKDKTRVTTLEDAFGFATASQKSWPQSGRAAVKLLAPAPMLDDGTVQAGVRLLPCTPKFWNDRIGARRQAKSFVPPGTPRSP
jgi:hypothetical protein